MSQIRVILPAAQPLGFRSAAGHYTLIESSSAAEAVMPQQGSQRKIRQQVRQDLQAVFVQGYQQDCLEAFSGDPDLPML